MTPENEHTPYNLEIFRKRVKNITITVRPGRKVRITAPHGYDLSRHLKSREEWILKQINKYEAIFPESEEREGQLLYNGEYYPLEESRERCGIFPDEKTAYYTTVKEFRKWLKDELRDDLGKRLNNYSEIMDASFSRFTVRAQKTKWGSCSSSGSLNFNIRMAAIPNILKNYIVIHELAHRHQLNHSSRFWEIVGRYDCNFMSHREELKKYWIMTETSGAWNIITED